MSPTPLSMIRLVPAAVAAVLAFGAVAAANGVDSFQARGNEPFWSLTRDADAITFQPMDGDAFRLAPVPKPAIEGGAEVYRGTAGGEAFVLTVADTVCTDTMSGMPFPATVMVAIGDRTFDGCGGAPVALLLGDWMVKAIDGKPPIADTEPTLAFAEDGKLSGAASCNRFFGGYTLTGEGLSVGALGASMMACEEPVMAQERAVTEILEGVTNFAIAGDGSLVLTAADGRTLTARRAS
jgi:heat shock protein HslJ